MTDQLPAKHPATIHDGSKPLPHANHEDFAQGVVRLNNQAAAWREIFDPTGRLPSRVSWVSACQMAARIDVGVRIDWLRAQSFERSQISVANLMRDLYDIASADASELTRMVVTNCRYCHGAAFRYQWVDVAEFAAACEVIEVANRLTPKAPRPLPSFDGGVGFDHHGAPNARCPECMGVGIRTPWVADTTDLSDKARKLYKGVKVKSDGSIEILMHDQLAARDQLHKLAGAYKAEVQTMAPPASAQPGDAPSDPAQSYLGMIHGGQARKVG